MCQNTTEKATHKKRIYASIKTYGRFPKILRTRQQKRKDVLLDGYIHF